MKLASVFVWLRFLMFALFDAHPVPAARVRCAVGTFILFHPRKNEPRKRTKGLNALWKPETRKVVPLSLHSFFREGKQLQPLRLQVKETCKHERRTQAKKQKFLLSATRPGLTNFFYKNDFASPACRAWWQDGERCIGSKMSFSSVRYVARHRGETPEGTSGRVFLVRSLPRGKE